MDHNRTKFEQKLASARLTKDQEQRVRDAVDHLHGMESLGMQFMLNDRWLPTQDRSQDDIDCKLADHFLSAWSK